MNGHKGKGKDSMGTGTVIGDHTLITNAHVIDDKMEKLLPLNILLSQ